MPKIFFFISFFFLISSCSKIGVKEISEIEDKYVESYESWNLEIDTQKRQDSVLYYIDELIKLSKDDFYKIEKIKILCRIEKYKEALTVFNILEERDSFAIELLRGLIEIKDNPNPKNENIVLQHIYQKYKSKKLTIEDNFYKIALDYYFRGGDYAIDEINSLVNKGKLTKSNEQLYEILKERIQAKEDRLDVLFYLFNL